MGFSIFLPLCYCNHKWITSGTVVKVALHIGQVLVSLHILSAQSKQMVAWLHGLKQALFLPFVLPLPESSSSKQTLQSHTVPWVVELWSNTSGFVECWSNTPSRCLHIAAKLDMDICCSCLALRFCSCCHKSNVNHNRYTTSSPHGLSDISNNESYLCLKVSLTHTCSYKICFHTKWQYMTQKVVMSESYQDSCSLSDGNSALTSRQPQQEFYSLLTQMGTKWEFQSLVVNQKVKDCILHLLKHGRSIT